MLEHFFQKMYITITDTVGEKRIDQAYLIRNLDSSKEVAVISMFSDNIQYQIRQPLKELLIMNEEKQLPEGVFTDRELTTTPLDGIDNIIKTDKLACIFLAWTNLALACMFLAWTNLTTLTTWKTEDSATSYLGIM